ncbi:phosphonate metabolism transcriptional regulator PhnF [Gemmobacter denitrificans]|uniref:Phosphonate metabolism transcriptional regulator PhnF n=1 Tax=Gemmobacter denitrificans TaxID=3123040 RepID=A0ABU8BYQ2_9RHOB
MARTPLWQTIASTLGREIAEGLYAPGTKLPTEAALAARFGVNRHTIRQALAHLAEQSVVHARRGSGVYVTGKPTEYPLGRRVRFHQNVLASGRSPSRRITRLETRPATSTEAEALKLDPGKAVHVIEGVSLADDQPQALFRSVFPAERFPDLLVAMRDHPSVTAALLACGLADYTRAETRLTAVLADGLQANALMLPAGAPLLRSVAVNVAEGGAPVEFGITWFAGDRVTLTVTPG